MSKQLFYLTNQEMVAYAWQGKELSRLASYDNDDAGRARFSEMLLQYDAVPAYLVVDVIEEDFQRDTAPHVGARARKALIERRLSQLYRDTPFRHAELQGRDKEGRKDDRLLFNALTNPELPRAWLAVMQTRQVPLVGIYSLASLGQLLFDRLKLDGGSVLLVTHQSSGLRQSFFQDGQLRFSRLTPLFDHAPERLAEAFRIETNKTRQFMVSSRLMMRGAKVHVVVLANAENLAGLQGELQDNADMSYRAMSIEQARAALGAGQFDTTAECNPLYLTLLASSRVESHFPLRDQRHFYQLLQTRTALHWFSGAVLIGALAWTAMDVMAILDMRREAERMELEAVATDSRYRAIVKDMPATVVTPHNMKSVVDIETMISQNVPLPTMQMAAISTVLNRLPQLRITRVNWQAVEPSVLAAPADPAAAAVPPPPGDFPPPPGQLGIPDKTGQVVLLEGEIIPFKGDYRAAIDSVNQLAAQLNRDPGVRAEVTTQPIDTRPSVRLENIAGATDDTVKALFAIKVTWKP
ncbi:MAG: hypothetical protein V4633_18365 [Pseudomonadota bacterium]